MELSVKNISKEFKGIECMSDVSFLGKRGEILGVLAPRGSGKSLLLNLLRGAIAPDVGEVSYFIDNEKIQSKDINKHIGFLAENNPVYSKMSVYDFLNYLAQFYEMPRYLRKDRIRNLIKICGLFPYKYHLTEKLSRGNRQRLGLAQSLLNNPAFLYLDEPVSGLDPRQSEQMYELIKEVGRERVTILTSSRMRDIENMCDTMLVLSNGTVLAKGTVEELQQQVADSSVLKVGVGNATTNDFFSALQKIDYIQIVGHKDRIIDIHTTEEERFAKDLFDLCAKKEWYIRHFVSTEKTLEDIFKQLRKN